MKIFTSLTIAAIGALCLTVAPKINGQINSQNRVTIGYEKSHEVTLNGTIQEVLSKGITGGPVGMHLLVAGPQGVVDTHLGPYLNSDTREALHIGEPVQIVGAMSELHARSYLLARQLIFAGRSVTVRSERGFLLRANSTRVARTNARQAMKQVGLSGGAR